MQTDLNEGDAVIYDFENFQLDPTRRQEIQSSLAQAIGTPKSNAGMGTGIPERLLVYWLDKKGAWILGELTLTTHTLAFTAKSTSSSTTSPIKAEAPLQALLRISNQESCNVMIVFATFRIFTVRI